MICHKLFIRIASRLGVLLLLAASSHFVLAQEEKDLRPARPAFESIYIIDNPTVEVPNAKTLEFDIQHRFGTFGNGFSDLFGIFGPSNIRLGISYTPINNLSVGFGTTKFEKLQDFNIKYAIIKQKRKGGFPLSITYFGNGAIEAKSGDNYKYWTDRLSFFHQVIIARRVTRNFSLQVAPSLSHFNRIDENMKNDHFAITTSARYKVSPQMAIQFSYDQPLTAHTYNNPHPNLSLGIEIATSGHAFQVFVTNYNSLVPQYNHVFNINDFRDGDFLIGFNITRLWGF